MILWAARRKALVLYSGFLLSSLLFLVGFVLNGGGQVLNFKPISGPIENPLMGLAPWATIKESKQPHTLVYADLTWREFEPQQGVYDFDSFESKNQLERWRAENKRVIFRFVCDRPGVVNHTDIPDWLFKAMDGDGDRYSNEYGKGFSPDYSNPTFIKFHQAAIQAIGDRYGKDGFFAAVELGSLGHWGEWHVHNASGIRRLPAEEIRNQYVSQYIEAFPNTFLLMRRPFNIAKQLNLGLYNDMTGDLHATNEWLDWIANGGDYDQANEANALSPMPNAWQTAPVGGEQTSSMSQEAIYGSDLDQTLRLLEESHTTFIGPNGPYQIDPGGPLQSGIDRVLEKIGYRIYIKQVRLPLWTFYKTNLKGSVTFTNKGAAPMYYNWPVQVYLLDKDGQIKKTFQPKMDVRKILPGKSYTASFDIPLRSLGGGKYKIGLAILDPMTKEPAVRFAMTNPRSDLIQELGQFEIVDLRQFIPR